MCGFVGGIFVNQSVDYKLLEKSLNTLEHRGPDENAIFIKNNVGLGHARLSIIDLEGGKQPLHSADNTLHLVANGEIYNYIEVGNAFREQKKSAITQSDCEAIIQAYQAEGPEGVKHLNGMFAFALYDEQKERVVLARDRLGIKPLFYTQNANGLFFASEIKALLPFIEKANDIQAESLAQFLQHQFHTGRDTIFSQIKRVLPGELLIYENNTLNHQSYWDPSDIATKDISLNEALEEFTPLFKEVMDEHMRSDVPLGLFLSGGIDSSLLLKELVDRHDQGSLNTYTIGYSGTKQESELDAANSLAKQFNTQHHAVSVSREQLFSRIVHSIWSADDLMRDYASLPTHYLAEVAAKDLKVVFSGEGGDEAFAGYRRYAPTTTRWLYHSLLNQPVRIHDQWSKSASEKLFSKQLKSCNTKEYAYQMWNKGSKLNLMQQRQYVDIKTALPDNLLVKTDRMMMAFGLEGRVPFSDHRVIEFGLSLPNHVKYINGRGKWLLRKWAQKSLPQEHLQKPKRGFYVPVKEWLTGDFLVGLESRLLNSKAIQYWFNTDSVKLLFTAQKSGKNYSREIWGLMQFAIWHRLFIDAPQNIPSVNENPLDWI